MVTKVFFLTLVLLPFGTMTDAQDYFIPYNFQQAVRRGTRTNTGVPGEKYFQNYSDYNIRVNIDTRHGILNGEENIVYHNNSPDTLSDIVMRLYQNIFKKGALRDDEEDPANINDGMQITSLAVNNKDLLQAKARYKVNATNMIIYLKKGLNPSDSCRISVVWHFKLPVTPVHRFGKYGDNSWFVGYWYPQISVYDDIDGWDMMNYNGTQEFYNDFNNYNVDLTLPPGYFAWMTGEWLDADKILAKHILEKYQQAKTSDNVQHVISIVDRTTGTIFRKGRSHTFKYKAMKVPDFAFAISKSFLWDATSAEVDSSQHRRVFVSAVYPAKSRDFQMVDSLAREIILRLNYDNYKVTFPFPAMTVFNGSDGMEYPMIVNDGSMYFRDGTIFLSLHEIAHTYFPFLTGLNERKYSWMDEGLTTYLPMKTEKAMHSSYFTLESVVNRFDNFSGTEKDVPLNVLAYQTRGESYQYYSYFRPSVAYAMLEDYMGSDTFRLAIRNFIKIWKYKHPTAYDFFAVLRNSTSKDIDWFISRWFMMPGWADLAIDTVHVSDNIAYITIKNKGQLPVPVVLSIKYSGGVSDTITRSPEVWKNSNLLKLKVPIKDEVKSIKLGNFEIPDKNRKDNYYKLPDKP